MAKKKTDKIKSVLKNIKLLILDVDGVLTKGEIIYDDWVRQELKLFFFQPKIRQYCEKEPRT